MSEGLVDPVYWITTMPNQHETDVRKAIKAWEEKMRENPGETVHLLRTIQAGKVAAPEVQPIQELNVGPGQSTEKATIRPVKRQPYKCLHLDQEHPNYCMNYEKVAMFFSETAGVTGKHSFICEGAVACYKTCPEYKEAEEKP